jgi:PAS domain S-box-containing protein
LAVDPEEHFKIVAVSSNTPSFLHRFMDARQIIGLSIADAISAGFEEETIARYRVGRLRGTVPWRSTLRKPEVSEDMDSEVHCHAGLIVIELQTSFPGEDYKALMASRQLQESFVDLQESEPDIESLARVAARAIRSLLDYERVIIYRFAEDWHGQAIAEDMNSDWLQSLEKLHFPESDIPFQARQLYRKSHKRWVADRDATAIPILMDPASVHKTIDLSFAHLRSLSPIHLEYHRNMGVNGSMSLSILDGDRLWGLVICHHRRPHHPSPGQRLAAIVLTNAFALRVGPAEHADSEQARRANLAHLADLFTHMADADDVTGSLTTGGVTVAGMFSSTGAAVIENGAVTLLGVTPPDLAVRALGIWLSQVSDPSKVFHTDRLSAVYPRWESHAAVANGILSIFLSDDRADMLLFFRPEEAQLISWGGNPDKGTDHASSMIPRHSFEKWVSMRRGFARAWLPWELESAESLRQGIKDVIVRSLRRIKELAADRERLVNQLIESNKALERTAQSEERSRITLKAVVDHALDGIITIDEHGSILSFNAACTVMFGYMLDEVMGKNIKMLMPEPYHDEHDGYLSNYVTTGNAKIIGTFGREVSARRKNGSVFAMNLSVSSFTVDNVRHFSGIIRDITKQKQLENNRERLLVQLTESNAELERFAYVASHDMQEPLRTVLNFTQVLVRDYADVLDDEGKEYLSIVGDSAGRMREMVHDLLEYARLGQEGMTLGDVDTDLELTHVRRNLTELVADTNALITWGELPTIWGNAVQIMRLLQNLISNAIKYQPPDRIPAVHVAASKEHGHWLFSVRDNGLGIDPAFIKEVFEPYRRLHSWKSIKGTGLGLAVCRRIVENHGGRIWANSAPGHGTTMFFTLP